MQRAKRRILEKFFILFSLGMLGGYLSDRDLEALAAGERSMVAVLGVLVLIGVVSDFWRSDEFERRLHQMSLSVAFFGTAGVVLGLGVLQAAGSVPLNWVWVYILMMALATVAWAVAAIWYSR